MAMRLTKYERVHVVSARADALVAGAEPLLPVMGALDPLLIAMEELKRGLLTSRIVRQFPSGDKEEYTLESLL